MSLTDVDPKSVLCAFYKQGQCTKGAKCKFSHDLLIERKVKISLNQSKESLSSIELRHSKAMTGVP